MSGSLSSNKRIAKNTLLLYIRTIFTMIISLFTSRIVLATLGVDNYGIYNVVGGVVAMFGVISGSLSGSISRFITFELGHGDLRKLKTIFSTSVNIQMVLSIIIILIGETIGLWFLNTKMNIPAERLYAANWVLHLSLLSFVINLLSIPYNAAIVAHEKMSTFAYVSILEASLKLAIVYLLYISPWDKLIVYSFLLVMVSFIIRIIYGVYCNRHFKETHYSFVYDRTIVKEMTSFAGWGFIGNSSYMLNNHGINILINLFFGVSVNAARGVAVQVEGALIRFVNDFSTALNPQITKSYAAGDTSRMYSLINNGARFTYFLNLLISLPIIVETPYMLNLWLVEVPEHAVAFIRLTIIVTMLQKFGETGFVACMATGNIRKYAIWINSVACLIFPLTWLLFESGAPVEATYVIMGFVAIAVNGIRLWLMKGLLNFKVEVFIKDVILRSLIVTSISCVLPLLLLFIMPMSFVRLFLTIIICVISTCISIYFWGLNDFERKKVMERIHHFQIGEIIYNK